MKQYIVLAVLISSLLAAFAFGFHAGRSGIPGDINHDGVVNIYDFSVLASHYHQTN